MPGPASCALAAALDNLRLSLIEPEECAALRSEVTAWAGNFHAQDRFHLLRLVATLSRARRLAETYTDRINHLFLRRAEELGRALEIEERAIKVFSEGDIRGHILFQLSRLVDAGLQVLRQALRLPPWEAIVPGEASGTLAYAATLAEVEGAKGPLLLLLEQADGDADIPACVAGIALGHPLPVLSHLGVRAGRHASRSPRARSGNTSRTLSDLSANWCACVSRRTGYPCRRQRRERGGPRGPDRLERPFLSQNLS